MSLTGTICNRTHGDEQCSEPMFVCQEHDQSFCPVCTGECPKCLAGEPSPPHFCGTKMRFCRTHVLNWCPKCSSACPLCRQKAKDGHTCVADHFCDTHDRSYCVVCGCPDCYADVRKQCSKCKQLSVRLCRRGRHRYCTVCERSCPSCRSSTLAPTIAFETPPTITSVILHQCGTALSKCTKHDCTFCPKCKNRCPKCEDEASRCKCGGKFKRCSKGDHWFCKGCETRKCKEHGRYCNRCHDECPECVHCSACNETLIECKFHGQEFCPKCDKECGDCGIEKKLSGYNQHTCGVAMAFCVKHNAYMCPECDEGTECGVKCDVGRHVGHRPSLEKNGRERWAEFLTWQSERKRADGALEQLIDTWTALSRRLYDELAESARSDADLVELFIDHEQAIKELRDVAQEIDGTITEEAPKKRRRKGFWDLPQSPPPPAWHYAVTIVEVFGPGIKVAEETRPARELDPFDEMQTVPVSER